MQNTGGVPPSTRQFAKDYANFYAVDDINDRAYDSVKTLKDSNQAKSQQDSGTKSAYSSQQRSVPNTRQFAKAYAQFYGIQED